MNEGINRRSCIEAERQPGKKLRDNNSIISHNHVISKTHLSVARLDLCNRNIGYFATGTASCRDNNKLTILDQGDLVVKSIHYISKALDYKELSDVDNRTTTNGDYTAERSTTEVTEDAIHHLIGGFSLPILLLHYKAAGETKFLHKRLINELVSQYEVVLIELKILCKLGKSFRAMQLSA